MEPGYYTHQEILSQPEAWMDALDVVENCKDGLKHLLSGDYHQVIFTGCGSTYYLSLAAASLFQEMTGCIARAAPASELLLNPHTILTGSKTLLVAVSRSGSTTETVRAVDQFKKQGQGKVIVITNYANQPLAGLADLALIIAKGQEQSVAQTRSFASMYVASTALTMLAAGREELRASMRQLPSIGSKLLTQYEPLANETGKSLIFDRFYFLGSGGRYGLACEMNLKMKEMTLTHSEPFHFLEFRHGPMSMVTDTTMMVGLLSDTNRIQEQKVLTEMEALGAKTLCIGESGAKINFDSNLPESIRNVLYLPVLQLASFYRAKAKNLNPDHPNNLTAVVTLNLP
jgi:glucosamine--fructose-6-phosphate aminotransferase (isomerizing)